MMLRTGSVTQNADQTTVRPGREALSAQKASQLSDERLF